MAKVVGDSEQLGGTNNSQAFNKRAVQLTKEMAQLISQDEGIGWTCLLLSTQRLNECRLDDLFEA
jgi:hypothetical protein